MSESSQTLRSPLPSGTIALEGPRLVLFDLDNTLIAGDSDTVWIKFLADQGLLKIETFLSLNAQFDAEYESGALDMAAFCCSVLVHLSAYSITELSCWRKRFLHECIEPLILVKAESLIKRHLMAGDHPVLVTATNDFIAAPIAERLGIIDVLATPVEIDGDRLTGRLAGTPCFREGKVGHVETYCHRHGAGRAVAQWAAASTFYTDSYNDLPLLSWVGHPVAVDPDSALAEKATEAGWPIISLRPDIA